VIEYFPLYTKGRIVRAVKEGHNDPKKSLVLKNSRELSRGIFIDVEGIRSFYGDEIAIYFEWMNFLLKFLLVPAIFAIIVYIGNMTFYTNESSPLSAYYSLMMTFWGVVFTVFWRRHCHGLNVLWDDYVTENDTETLRKEFRGRLAINPVTDKPDTVFTFTERIPYYIISAVICIPCLGLCIFVIICFLNMTGVIRPEHHEGFFDIPSLSALANPGAIFDPESNLNMVIGGV
jgi:hypothetical protein